jgi:hypothetical protein
MKTGLSRSPAARVAAALLLGVALSCASSKVAPDPAAELRAGIGEIAADPARAAAMLAAVDEIEAAAADLHQLVTGERAELLQLLRDHGSSRAAAEASLAVYSTRRDAVTRRVLAAHAALKAETTAAEWKKLRRLEMEMILFAASSSVGQAPAGKEG